MFKLNSSRQGALVLLATLTLQSSAVAASAADLFAQGDWAAAAEQPVQDNDPLTGALAVHRLMECPAPARPKGQVWTYKQTAQAAAFARQALAGKLNDADRLQAYISLADNVGNQAQTTSNLAETLKLARDSKSAYESAVKLDSNDFLAAASLAIFYARSYFRGGVVIGVTKGEAQNLTTRAARLFNTAPDATKAQMLRKAWGAVRLGGAYEGLGDKKLVPYYEAAIKLGEASGTPSGLCAANVARVHLGRAITKY